MIGKAIEYYLELRKMNQKTLAEKAELSSAAVTQYIKGSRNPSDKRLEKIASALEISLKELKDTAESYSAGEFHDSNETYIDERQIKRRIAMIDSRYDLTFNLSKYVILAARFRIHDLLFEADPSRKGRRPMMGPMDREVSPIEAISEKVIRQFLLENQDEIADRIEDEIEQTQISLEEIIENMRNSYTDY